jgi:hypothetical protein
MIKEANVTVIVSGLNRGIKFYTEAMGLKLGNQLRTQWAEIRGPGLTIGLHPPGPHYLNPEIQKVLP